MSDAKVIIDLCSSDEEEDEGVYADENNCEEGWLEEMEEEEEEDDSTFSEDEDDSDWTHDDATESEVDSDKDDEIRIKGDDDDDNDDKVTRLLTAGSDLKALNLKECKAYLRKHGLRLSGTKAVCVERIVKHWRIKDGSGEAIYPRSSFAINCKGDVCKGDTVLFTQKVHQKYEKMKGSGKTMGKRTVAGHVIKESYGTAKQQHTFTIEVLWCEGIQKLPPLYPLLVKGRNLYRLMTLRQRWANEDERVKILSEKHSRGAAARKVMRERKIKLGYILKDGRLQKPGHMKKPCQVKTRTNKKDENLNQRLRQDPSQGHNNPTQLRNMNPPFHSYTSHPQSLRPHPPLAYVPRPFAPQPRAPLTHAPRSYGPFNVPNSHLLPRPNIHPSHSQPYPTQQSQSYQRPPPAFYNRRPDSNPLRGQASFNPHAMPVTHQSRPYQNHHTSFNRGYNYGVRGLDHFSDMTISHRTEGETHRQSQDNRRPYKNHHTHHSNANSGYNQGARDSHIASHRREGDTHRPNYR